MFVTKLVPLRISRSDDEANDPKEMELSLHHGRIFLPSTHIMENRDKPPQLNEGGISGLLRQRYKVVGTHSTVKVCGWTKNSLTGKGTCYKHKFYGIVSHRCLQMSTSVSCPNRCVFCWRDYKAPVSIDWPWKIEAPKEIIKASQYAQRLLLMGYHKREGIDQTAVTEAFSPKHVALSLTGEPIAYPRFGELLDDFHDLGISTFVVTKAQFPDAIKDLKLVTQLYLSIDAADPETLKEIDKPLFDDAWERMLLSLDLMKEKDFRTAVRLTMVKGMNTKDFEGYARLMRRGMPDFIEIKAYMHVGASRERLDQSAMPTWEDMQEYARELVAFLPEYEINSEHQPSLVILLTRSDCSGKNTWIDFDAFFEKAKLVRNHSSDAVASP